VLVSSIRQLTNPLEGLTIVALQPGIGKWRHTLSDE
jgi:hypothetical protein